MSEKPEWIRWYMTDWDSDSFVKSLDWHWRGVYFDILNTLALEGSIEWSEDAFFRKYGKPENAPETRLYLAKIQRKLRSKKLKTGLFVESPKMNEARESYLSYHEQKRLAGQASGKARRNDVRTNDGTKKERRSSDVPTERERYLSLSLSNSNSYSNSYSEFINKYNSETQLAITGAIETAKQSRKTGKISDSVIRKLIEVMARYPPETVYEGCRTYCEQHEGKSEKYLLGIIRGKSKEPTPKPEFDIDKWVPPEERKH